MLELIKEELRQQGVLERQFISINLESRNHPFIANVEGIYAYIDKFLYD
jgi:hypothetical protein